MTTPTTTPVAASMLESRTQATGRLLAQWRDDAGFSQAELGRAIGVSERTVWTTERGARMPDDIEIARLERALRLNAEQREMLWELTRRPPPVQARRPNSEEEMLRKWVDSLPFPALVMDSCWDLQYANAPALSLWDWLRDRRHGNLLLRCLTSPVGRARLLDWENTYASPLLAQLRLASVRSPGSQRLAELREAVLDGGQPQTRAVLRRHWEHPDGRRLCLAPEVWVRLPAVAHNPVLLRQQLWTPGHSGLRLWVMEPVLAQRAAA